ncbi:putative splicing factor [Nosema granulosis]|uniref:Splicing factor n=1 Tax=Nosema granulosis TaxID=83296 RepID=A0A9P6H3A8_9MICR|nr:putative splicing factor [Nosema granulosis]
MKVFIGKISPDMREEDVRRYFETFGEIFDFNFKGAFAFVEYRDENVARRVVDQRDHQIGDFSVITEESKGKKRSRYDSEDDYSRRPPAGGYDDFSRGRHEPVPPYEDHYDPYRRRDPYNDRAFPPPPAPYYDDRRAPDYYRGGYPPEPYPRDPRDECPHCSRCEVHGVPPRRMGGDFDRPKRPKRDHPNDVNKIVIESLPHNVVIEDVEDLVRKEGFEIVFSRLTVRGDSAIVELRDVEEKEKAMDKLQGKEINGTQISVRNFRTSVTSSGYEQNNNYNSERREEGNGGVDVYSGIDSVNVD